MLTHSANHTYDQTAHMHKLNPVQRPTIHHYCKISLFAFAPWALPETHTSTCRRTQAYTHTTLHV